MEDVSQLMKLKVDSAVSSLSDVALSTVEQYTRGTRDSARAFAVERIQPAVARAQELLSTAQAHYGATEQLALQRAREGVYLALEHPNAALATAGLSTLLLLPPSRRALYNATVGRLRSDAAVLASAERALGAQRESLGEQSREIAKLTERVALAEVEYARGRAKLLAAGGQLRGLAASARKTEDRLAVLLDDSRHLRSPLKKQMVTDAAAATAAAAAQRAAVEKHLKRVANMVPI